MADDRTPAEPRNVRRCEIDGCSDRYLARGMCRKHYERDRRGAPLHVDPIRTLGIEARFWAKVDRHGPVPAYRPDLGKCWIWTGALFGRDVTTGGGYPYLQNVGGSNYAHRVAYELFVGAIPGATQIDHLCRVRQCVRPTHLEAVTPAENQRRGWQARKVA